MPALGARAKVCEDGLIASERLAYLRHLAVSRGRWRRLQGAHLPLVNAPGIGVVVYGLVQLRSVEDCAE